MDRDRDAGEGRARRARRRQGPAARWRRHLAGAGLRCSPRGRTWPASCRRSALDAMTSHWEFTYGAERVKEIARPSKIAFLAQNIRDNEWHEPVFAPRKTFEKGGVEDRRHRAGPAAHRRSPIPRWMMPEWEFGLREDDIAEAGRGGACRGRRVVVLLSHNGYDVDRKLAGRVKGIDVILTAHTHDAMPGRGEGRRHALVASGSHGKFVSRLDHRRSARRQGRRLPLQADAGLLRRDRARSGHGGDDRDDPRALCTRARREIGRTDSCSTGAATSTARSTT
jgi:sulfur-oxidizing protein SoxB